MSGYCGIGIYHAKWDVNIGTLWRSAHCLGAQFIYSIGPRFRHQATDTTKAYRHIPYWQFETWDEFVAHVPYGSSLIGVEIASEARPLESFVHPKQAVYLLGPEDGSLPTEVLAKCQHVLSFTSKYCLNVAMAGTVVLYDRQSKMRNVAGGAINVSNIDSGVQRAPSAIVRAHSGTISETASGRGGR